MRQVSSGAAPIPSAADKALEMRCLCALSERLCGRSEASVGAPFLRPQAPARAALDEPALALHRAYAGGIP